MSTSDSEEDLQEYFNEMNTKIQNSSQELILVDEIIKKEQMQLISTKTSLTTLDLSQVCNSLHRRLNYISPLISLQQLNLSYCALKDSDIEHLSTLTNLQHLNLENNEISGDTFTPNHNLLTLNLKNNNLSDEGVENIVKCFNNLETLRISPSTIKKHKNTLTNKSLEIISTLEHLKTLEIKNVFTITDFSPLSNLETLQELDLLCLGTTEFPSLPHLKKLIVDAKISYLINDRIEEFGELEELVVQYLKNSNIKELKNLKKLGLNINFKNEDIEQIQGMDWLEELDLSGNPLITDEVFEYIPTSIKKLNMILTHISKEKYDEFFDQI